MKAIIILISIALLAMGVSACAPAPTKAPPKVLCPACGYEFHPPLSGF